MPLTPEDVRNREFRTAFRGYNEEEVDAFLDEIEVELGRLVKDNDQLEARLKQTQLQAQAAPAAAPISEGEEMLRRTLLLAQRTADETIAQAKSEAEQAVTTARAQAAEILSNAETQARTAVADLERKRTTLEQEIEGLRAFEREYRTRLKAYLETQLRDLEGRGGSAGGTPAPATPPMTTGSAAPPVPTPTPAPAAGRPPVTAVAPEPPPTPVPLTAPMVVTDEGGEVPPGPPRVAP